MCKSYRNAVHPSATAPVHPHQRPRCTACGKRCNKKHRRGCRNDIPVISNSMMATNPGIFINNQPMPEVREHGWSELPRGGVSGGNAGDPRGAMYDFDDDESDSDDEYDEKDSKIGMKNRKNNVDTLAPPPSYHAVVDEGARGLQGGEQPQPQLEPPQALQLSQPSQPRSAPAPYGCGCRGHCCCHRHKRFNGPVGLLVFGGKWAYKNVQAKRQEHQEQQRQQQQTTAAY